MKSFVKNSLLIVCFLSAYSTVLLAQTPIKLKLIDAKDKKPLRDVYVVSQKGKIDTVTNISGEVELSAEKILKADSISFINVGYQTVILSISTLQKNPTVAMQKDLKSLEDVVIQSKIKESSDNSKDGKSAYFRSWFTKENGAEIGRVMYIESEDYIVEKVRFRINNQCDTCQFKLHIRSVDRNKYPDEDLLDEDVFFSSGKRDIEDPFIEIDLRKYKVRLFDHSFIYVSLETVACANKSKSPCSLAIIGTEKSEYVYRNGDRSSWAREESQGLYLKVFYKLK